MSPHEAAQRQQHYGPNDILEVPANPWVELVWKTLKDPLIWFLIGTGAVYAVLNSYAEALMLLVAILSSVGMDALLHRRAQSSRDDLSRPLAQKARVLRDGVIAETPVTDLVPGDLVEVATGEPFPADGLIVGGEGLQADESSLTGEGCPVAKWPLSTLPTGGRDSDYAIWIDGDHWGFAGTRLLTGKAMLRVVFTGWQTRYGDLVHAAVTGDRECTPVQHAFANLGTLAVACAGTLCLIFAGVRGREGPAWIDALITVASSAVAALPEAFPAVLMVFLAIAVYRLARRKTFVRRAVSVKNISRTTCMRSGKTDAITDGGFRLKSYRALEMIARLLHRLSAEQRSPALEEIRGESSERGQPETALSVPPLTRYAWLSVLTAVVTIILKANAYFVTGSVALLSDAAESLVNLVGAGFALIILKVAARPADENHPFGHGKAEYFSSGFEGALILVAATGIAWAAWDRLMHPQALEAINLGIVVSVVATVLNLLMARVLLRKGRQFGSITLEADGRHLMTDVWTTGAVLLGLGGIALTGWQWLDAAIAFLAALNIVGSGSRLILRSLSGLIGEAIPPEERQRIECILEPYRRKGFQFHDLRARVAGTQRLVTLHVLVPGVMSVQEAHALLEEIESEIRGAIPNLLIVTHLEPLEDPSSFRHDIIQNEFNHEVIHDGKRDLTGFRYRRSDSAGRSENRF